MVNSNLLFKQIVAAVLLGSAASNVFAQTCAAPTNQTIGFAAQTPVAGCVATSFSSLQQAFSGANGAFSGVNFSVFDTTAGTGTGSFYLSGLQMTISTTTLGAGASNTIVFSAPQLGLSTTASSATGVNDFSKNKTTLKNFIIANDLYSKILAWQSKNSPTSALTGVSGLIPAGVAEDFNQSFTYSATNIAAPSNLAAQASENGKTPNLIGVGLEYSSINQSGVKVNSYTLPLSYTVRNDLDPRRQLLISVPLTYSTVGGGTALNGGLGVGYRVPMNDNWTLTPSGKYSAVVDAGSGTLASVWNGAMASTYLIPTDSYVVGIGNMLSYNKTGRVSIGNYVSDPKLQYWVTRNGVLLSQPVTISGSKMSLEYSLVDMRYIGKEKPFVDNTQEIGVTVGTNKDAYSAKSFLRAGLAYVTGKATSGVRLNLGYWF